MPQQEVSDDFKYIVRMANTDIDGHRPTMLALTSIKGVGRRAALSVIRNTDIDPKMKIGDISDEHEEILREEIDAIVETLPPWMLNRQKDYDTGEDTHLVGTEVALTRTDDINRLKKIRCYRGIRHETGQKVRGQRTKANGRSGLTLGVSRQKSG